MRPTFKQQLSRLLPALYALELFVGAVALTDLMFSARPPAVAPWVVAYAVALLIRHIERKHGCCR
jgi:hypothetical protein